MVLLAYASYEALVVAPTDALQGDVYRIIYYHVPSAWTAFLLFFINFVASIQYLARTKAAADKGAKWFVIGIGVSASSRHLFPQVQHSFRRACARVQSQRRCWRFRSFYFLMG